MTDELIPIASLQERYGLNSRQAVYDRISALKLTPAARGKLSTGQVDKLDKLDQFLKSTPGAAIADFPKSTEVVEMGKLDKVEMSSSPLDKPDNFTETLQLVEAIAKHFSQQRDPLLEYKALIFAAEQNLILPSSKVLELVGIKPHGQQFERGSFRFTRSRKVGGQSGWKIEKI